MFNKITNSKNGFDLVTDNLKLLKQNNNSFVLNMVVSKLNLNEIENTISFLKNNYDIRKICVTRVGKPVNSDYSFNDIMLSFDDFKMMQKTLIFCKDKYNVEIDTACPYTPCSIYTQEAFDYFAYKKACTAGKTSYSIDCNGNVKACPRESKSYGNILNEDFSNIWDNMKLWRNGSIIPEKCKKCAEYSKCLGGCRMDMYPFTHRYDELDCISNMSNVPIKFKNNLKHKNKYNTLDTFKLNKNVIFVKEDNFYRASSNKKYCYITDEFFHFFENMRSFNVNQLVDTFEVDINDIYKIIDILIVNNIIYKSEKGGIKL